MGICRKCQWNGQEVGKSEWLCWKSICGGRVKCGQFIGVRE